MINSGGRREYLLAAGALLGGTSIAVGSKSVVSGNGREVPYDSRRNAGFKTDNPVVTDVDVSLDSSSDDSYVALIRTQEEADERYRVDYLQDAYDMDVSELYTVDYETEFLTIVGHVLPKKRNLSLDAAKYEGRTLQTSHEITDSDGLTDSKIHHNLVIYRQEGHEPPKDIEADFSWALSAK